MPKFVKYKYDFKEGEKTLLSTQTGERALQQAQTHFGKLLQGKMMNLYKMVKKNTESEIFKNDIFCTRNGITYPPTEGIEVDNCQVLGIVKAMNKSEAILTLIKENNWINDAGYSTDKMIVKQIIS